MKKTLLVVMSAALSMIAGIGVAEQKGVVSAGASYSAAVVYAGEYKSDTLLCKKHPEDTVWRLIPRFDRLYKVTCQDALDSLNRDGTWTGNLKFKDGSCTSTAEGSEWATGNRRNYDRIREGDGN